MIIIKVKMSNISLVMEIVFNITQFITMAVFLALVLRLLRQRRHKLDKKIRATLFFLSLSIALI